MLDLQSFKQDLATLVNIDSGSANVDGITKVNSILAQKYQELGYQVEWFDVTSGPQSKAFIAHSQGYEALDLLILCHTDTVFGDGEAQKRPYTESADGLKAFGPGVSDMKAGCLFAYYAAKYLKENNHNGNFAILYNPQEEIGSAGTRELIENLSKKSKIVIALEAARANGDCVNQRKGVGRYTFTFRGKKAHAGVNPQDGASAIVEMAHCINYLDALNDFERGLTVNSGVVEGGSVANIVPDYASLKIDMRMTDYQDGLEAEKKFFDYVNHRHDERVEVEITGKITRPPMKPSKETLELCQKINELGKQKGFNVTWCTSGGGSDASFASGLGIIALDGLGPRGGKFHSSEEFLDLSDIKERFELLVDIIKFLTTK